MADRNFRCGKTVLWTFHAHSLNSPTHLPECATDWCHLSPPPPLVKKLWGSNGSPMFCAGQTSGIYHNYACTKFSHKKNLFALLGPLKGNRPGTAACREGLCSCFTVSFIPHEFISWWVWHPLPSPVPILLHIFTSGMQDVSDCIIIIMTNRNNNKLYEVMT